MHILSLVARKILHFALLALLLSFATFLLSSFIPGDFYSARQLEPSVSQATIEKLRQEEGIGEPLHRQYQRWLGRAASLDFGHSLYYQGPVADVVIRAFINTLWLGIPAVALGMAVGIGVGSLRALYAERPLGHALGALSTAALSLPTLLTSLAALLIAARTRWLPLGGMNSASLTGTAPESWLADRLIHLILPVVCLTIPLCAYVEHIQFSAAAGTLHLHTVRSARARGLSAPRWFLNHLVRPSLHAVVAISGPILGATLGGSLVVEIVFSWPGLGQVTYHALFNRDLHLLVGCVTATGLLLVSGSVVADLIALLIDARLRSSEGTAA